MILDNLFKIIKSNFDAKNNTPLTFEKSSVRGEWKFEYTVKKLGKFKNEAHQNE